MIYTKSKQDLLEDIRFKVDIALANHMPDFENAHSRNVSFDVKYAVGRAISEAFSVLLENTYTEQQFEEDLKLRT